MVSGGEQKVLRTKAVYEAQTGEMVAVEIGEVLEEFGIAHKVVGITVDNASNMTVAAKRLDILKLGCFAHTLNLAAQKVYNCRPGGQQNEERSSCG